MKRRRRRNTVIRLAILLGGLVIIVVPYLWIVLTAFKRPVDAAAVPPEIFSPFTTKNLNALVDGPFAGSLVASVIITVMTTVATMVLGVPAGYAVARTRWKLLNSSSFFFLILLMVPIGASRIAAISVCVKPPK